MALTRVLTQPDQRLTHKLCNTTYNESDQSGSERLLSEQLGNVQREVCRMSCGFLVLEAEGGYSQVEQLRTCPHHVADSLGALGNERAVRPSPRLLSVELHRVAPPVEPSHCLQLRLGQHPHPQPHRPFAGPAPLPPRPRAVRQPPGLSFLLLPHPSTFTFTPFPLPRISHSTTSPG